MKKKIEVPSLLPCRRYLLPMALLLHPVAVRGNCTCAYLVSALVKREKKSNGNTEEVAYGVTVPKAS